MSGTAIAPTVSVAGYMDSPVTPPLTPLLADGAAFGTETTANSSSPAAIPQPTS